MATGAGENYKEKMVDRVKGGGAFFHFAETINMEVHAEFSQSLHCWKDHVFRATTLQKNPYSLRGGLQKKGQEQQVLTGICTTHRWKKKGCAAQVWHERRLLQTAKSGWTVAMDQPALPGGNAVMASSSLTTPWSSPV